MEFNRKALKATALSQLKGRWGTAVLSGLIFLAIYLFAFAPMLVICMRMGLANIENVYLGDSFGWMVHFFSIYFLTLLIVSILIPILAMAYIYVISLYAKTSEAIPLSKFITGFSLWKKGLGGFWHRGVFIFLWTLLYEVLALVAFIILSKAGVIGEILRAIVGIIILILVVRKSLSYSLNIYLLADNPELKVTKALEDSMDYTEDNLGSLFVLQLSFIGWYLLSILTVGIGILWLAPYYTLTYFNTAMALKDETEKIRAYHNNTPAVEAAQETSKPEDSNNE